MKRSLATLLLVVLSFQCIIWTAYAKSPIGKVRINSDGAYVRNAPSVDSEFLGTAEGGAVYELVESRNGWYKIICKTGIEGWISQKKATIIQQNSPNATPKPSKSSESDEIKNLTVGSTITLGQYEQDNRSSNGKEPIEWRVLAVNDDRALVIASYALDAISYGKPMVVSEYSQSGMSWKTSYLRTWLNDTFFNAAFSAQEKENILSVDLTTQDASGKVQTKDRIFVLSVAEVNKYFHSATDMACKVTAYGKSKLKKDSGAVTSDGYCGWWVRDMSSVYKQADRYNFMDGTYNEAGYIYATKGTGGSGPVFCDYLISVRPAMWIRLNTHNPNGNSQTENQTPNTFVSNGASQSANTASISAPIKIFLSTN